MCIRDRFVTLSGDLEVNETKLRNYLGGEPRLANDDELKKCFHYTNLQPLWAKENRKKSGKYQEITEI